MHQHPQEQITVLRRGEVELTAGGRVSRLGPGEWSVVAGGVEHGITAGGRGASFLAILVPRRGPDEAITLTDTTETGATSR